MFHYQKGELNTLGKDATEKRVAQSKNLKGKMDNMKEEDFKRIFSNLTAQNQKLKQQCGNLNDKVNQLLEKRKFEKRQANHQLEAQIEQAKHNLQEQYKVVDHYKKQVQRQTQHRLEDKLLDKYNGYLNTEAEINAQKAQLLKEKKTLQIYIQQNTQSVKEYTDDSPYDAVQFERVAVQNKEMKRKFQSSKKIMTVKERQSQETIDKLLSLKHEHRKRLSLQPPQTVILPDSTKRKTDEIQVTTLQREVEELKTKKTLLQSQVEKQRADYDQRRLKMQKRIRDSLEIQKTLVREKTKVSNTLNMYQTVQRQSKEAAIKAEQPQIEIAQQRAVQTDVQVIYSFRRDWVGKMGKLTCDDNRLIVTSRERSFVKKMVVYSQGQTIVAIKFTYDVIGASKTTQLPLDEESLKKMTLKTFEASGDSYIKTFRVGIKENQITSVEVSSNTDEKMTFGVNSEGTVHYLLDIKDNERPLTIFQSFLYVGKDKYTLQAIGCDIFDP